MTRRVFSARPCARFTRTSPPTMPSVTTGTSSVSSPRAGRAPVMTRTAVASGVYVVLHPTVLPVVLPAEPFVASAGSSVSVAGSAVV
ncbi:Uncharacterised protein [Mycobacteroides abscessus]|nr:Uncharacterised protein [Mycobacteroides abscessus]